MLDILGTLGLVYNVFRKICGYIAELGLIFLFIVHELVPKTLLERLKL